MLDQRQVHVGRQAAEAVGDLDVGAALSRLSTRTTTFAPWRLRVTLPWALSRKRAVTGVNPAPSILSAARQVGRATFVSSTDAPDRFAIAPVRSAKFALSYSNPYGLY